MKNFQTRICILDDKSFVFKLIVKDESLLGQYFWDIDHVMDIGYEPNISVERRYINTEIHKHDDGDKPYIKMRSNKWWVIDSANKEERDARLEAIRLTVHHLNREDLYEYSMRKRLDSDDNEDQDDAEEIA